MSVARDARLDPRDAALKIACADAVHLVGGQALVASAVGRSQGRISDFCNASVPDFMPVDIAMAVDRLAHAATGRTPIAEAMARLADGGDGSAPDPLSVHLPRIAAEAADLLRAIADRMTDELSPLSRRHLLTEADQLGSAIADLVRDMVAQRGVA